MKMKFEVSYTRNEMVAYMDLIEHIRTISGSDAITNIFPTGDISIKAKSKLAAVMYHLHIRDELELIVDVEIGEEYTLRYVESMKPLIGAISGIMPVMKNAASCLEALNNEVSDFEEFKMSDTMNE